MKQPSSRGGWLGFLIGPGFLLLAAWMTAGPPSKVPVTKAAVFPIERLSTAPRREIVGDPPKIFVNNFDRTCTDCHRIFDVHARPEGDRLQHRHIVLDHGINDQCRNCHNYENMNQLVLYDGEPVAYADVPRLCQKCHGPVFMDWERGIHGRVNGSWDAERGTPRKLKCIQCHDPHRPRHPAMDPLVPLPGPNTLRMGPIRPHGVEDHAENDPLRAALLQPDHEDDRTHAGGDDE